MSETGPSFKETEPADFVIIGSGSAGGIIAKELASAGFNLVVLEQGPYRQQHEFSHDELAVALNNELLGGLNDVHAYLRDRIPGGHTVAFPGTILYDESTRRLRPDASC